MPVPATHVAKRLQSKIRLSAETRPAKPKAIGVGVGARRVCALLGWAIVVLYPMFANAQGLAGKRLKKKPLRVSGTIVRMRAPFVELQTKAGKTWLVQVKAEPADVLFEGEAQREWLRPKMWVRFTGRVDRRGKVQQPIRELYVFAPRAGYRVGLFREPDLDEPNPEDEENVSRPKNYLIAGQLLRMEQNELLVIAGRRKIRAELAEEVTLSVELADYRLARTGDKVAIKGWFYQVGRAVAEEITITAKKPIQAKPKPEKTARRRRESKKERRSPATTDD